MSELWAFFCEDCRFESGIRYEDPADARKAFVDACAELLSLRSSDQALQTPTLELAALFFVAEHGSHRICLVNDLGWLRLDAPCRQFP